MFRAIPIKTTLLATLFLVGCSSHAQLTSGQDYLARYQSAPVTALSTQTDLDVRDIAAIEPDLRFPARIGLARIEQGRLIGLPGDEAQDWAEMSDNLDFNFGEVVPVSPLVASMVNTGHHQNTVRTVVDEIRRGAARQHLDYVIIYEVNDLTGKRKNALKIADLSILGLFVLPSRNVEAKATASAMMIDVRNGYPYGTASSFATKDAISTAYGSSSKQEKLSEKARSVAVDELTDEVANFLRDLNHATDIKLTAER